MPILTVREWFDRSSASWALFLGVFWLVMAVGDGLHSDWLSALLHLGTGTAVVVTVVRSARDMWRMKQAQTRYLTSATEAEATRQQFMQAHASLMAVTSHQLLQDAEALNRAQRN